MCACFGVIRSMDFIPTDAKFATKTIQVCVAYPTSSMVKSQASVCPKDFRKKRAIAPGTAKKTSGLLAKRYPELAGIGAEDLIFEDD